MSSALGVVASVLPLTDAAAIDAALSMLASALSSAASASAAARADERGTLLSLRARCAALEEAVLAGDRAVADLEARLAVVSLDGAARGAAGLALRVALEAAATSVEAEALEHAK